MYVSDYGYASSNCENKKLYDTSSSSNDISACNGTNWLFKSNTQWLLSQYAGYSNYPFTVSSLGDVSFGVSDGQFGVRPVLYLTSSAKITGGAGTSSNPYKLSI